jgi:hypothetical protein
LRRGNDLTLLRSIYRSQGAAISSASTISHFNEYQHLTVEHDQIEFAELPGEIPGQQGVTVGDQILQYGFFSPFANR